jgi:uncharacterized protein
MRRHCAAARGYGYDVDRFRGQGNSSFGAYPDMDHRALDGLSLWLTARFGLHTRVGRRVFYLPIPTVPGRCIALRQRQ